VSDHPPSPVSKPKREAPRKKSLIPSVLAVLANAVFVAAMVFAMTSAMRFTSEGVKAQGTVVESKSGRKGRQYATIEYVDGEGNARRIEAQSDLVVGSTIEVTYLPSDSARGETDVDALTALPTVGLAFGLMGLTVSLALFLARLLTRPSPDDGAG